MRTEPESTDTNPAEPDRQSGDSRRAVPGKPNWRRNLFGIWIAQLLVIMGFSMRSPFLPMFFGELGVETETGQAFWAGLIMSIGFGAMAITSPIWGVLADKYGRKPMLVRAQFAACFTIGIASFVQEPWQMVGLRLIEGSLTGTVAAATALVAVSMPKERLGYGLGMVQTAVFSGSALGPLVGGFIADAIGYRHTFQISGLMAGVAGVITVFTVQEHFVRPEKTEASTTKRRSAWKTLLGPALLSLTLATLVVRFASAAVQPITPLFVSVLSGDEGAVNTLSGLTLGVLGVTSAIASIYLGRLGDKRGHVRILIACALGAGLVYLPMAAAQHPWQLIALQAVFGLFAGGLIPATNALIARVTPENQRGMVFGFMNTAGSMGGFAGPLAGAALAGVFGIRATFLLTGVVLLALAVLLFITSLRRPMEQGNAEIG